MKNFGGIFWWKYIILLGSFMNHVVVWGLAFSSGIFQIMLIEEFSKHGHIASISLVSSLVPTLTCLIGPLSSMLTNKFGCRYVSVFGSLLATAALLLSSVTNSIWQLFITFILLGAGLGITYVPSVVIVCSYFHRRRPIAIAFAATGLGVGTFAMPPLISFLVDLYHWRNSMILLAGITLQMIVFSMTFCPVPSTDENCNDVKSSEKIIRVKMLKQPSFLCLLLNNFLLLFGMVAFYVHLPAHLSTADFDHMTSALFVSIIGAGTIVGRLSTGLLTQCLTYPMFIYMMTMGFGGFIMILVPFFKSATVLATLCFLFGLGTSTIGPLLPLIITDLLGLDALSDSYGYLLVAEAIGSLCGPPFAGLLFDVTTDYAVSMIVSGILIILASAVMLYPWIKSWKRTNCTKIDNEEPLVTA